MNGVARVRRWIGEHLVLFLGLLVLIYMFVPIAVVVLMSFNDPGKSKNVYAFRSFTFHNWTHACDPAGMCSAVGTSLAIGALATVIATIIGTMAAFALVRHSFAGRSFANTIIFLPMASPEIVMGSSLLALFLSMSRIGVQLGFWTILIAHVMFCLSFVIVTVKARLAGLDENLEQAAMDLYATESQTFWRVTFPLVLPGILGAALLSLSLSFDDFIITNLNAGQSVTFPMFVWGASQRGVPMQVNVIGTAMFVISLVIVIAGELNNRRRQKALAS
jgi:spermidine/putrescine transport system permease protein